MLIKSSVFILLVSFATFSFQAPGKAYYFCDFKCKRMHTVCRNFPCHPTSKCGIHVKTTLSLKEKNIILNEHNKYRNIIAMGKNTTGGNSESSNMRALSYSKELEYVAQCWANACEDAYDRCRSTKMFNLVGQNIYVNYGKADFLQDKYLHLAVRSWFLQIVNTEESLIDSWDDTDSFDFSDFTQLMWARTTHVGCGRTVDSSIDGTLFIVCNYGPQGNWINESVYERGPPCSKCKSIVGEDGNKLKCNMVMQGLCGEAYPAEHDEWFIPMEATQIVTLPIELFSVIELFFLYSSFF